MYGMRSGADAARAACRPARPPVRLLGASVWAVSVWSVSLMGCSSRSSRSRAPARAVAGGARRPSLRPTILGAGSGTTIDSRVDGSVVCGMPIAPTKCSWNRGSIAVSIFSTRRTTSSISARAARFNSAMRAPVPAALPADVTCSGSQSGTSPRTSAWTGSMCAPNAPARRMRSTVSMPEVVHQQPAPGVERGLRQLDLAHVVLRDDQSRLAVVQHVGERAAVGHDPRRPRRQRAVDHAVRRQDARQEHLGDHLDDARAADPGDLRRVEPRLVGPCDRRRSRVKRGSSVCSSMRTRSIAPGAARWPQLICAPSNAGPVGLDAASIRSRLPRTISAFVPTSTIRFTISCWYGASRQDHARGVRADVAGDARQQVDARARVGVRGPGRSRGGAPRRRSRARTARRRARSDPDPGTGGA